MGQCESPSLKASFTSLSEALSCQGPHDRLYQAGNTLPEISWHPIETAASKMGGGAEFPIHVPKLDPVSFVCVFNEKGS